jgi:DNA-binding NarL/FixJ family response regulator
MPQRPLESYPCSSRMLTLPLATTSVRAIARRLQLTPGAVRAYVSHLVHKLGLASRDEAVAFFHETTDS